jgi:NADPH:quinone reductase-like Zn-dependent oxidoreductase
MAATFTAWDIPRYGAPEVLTQVTRPLKDPGEGEVLIRIRASAVTRADGMMRAGLPRFARPFLGMMRPRAGLSGTGLSGEVIATGSGVTRFAVGDAVFGEAGLRFGANATHIALPQDGVLLKKPETLGHDEAAVLSDGALTSWHFLHRVGQVRAGQRVLILAGAGSLGSAAVQIAATVGARVAASAGARNADLLAELGADHVIDYAAEDPLRTGSYDLIFDTIGVTTFARARRALAPGGLYMSPVLTPRLLWDMLRTRFTGGRRARFTAVGLDRPEELRAQLAEVLEAIAARRFAPVMDRSYPLEDLVAAQTYVAGGHKRGNVVVTG